MEPEEELQPQDFPDGGLEAYSVLFGSFIGLTVCLGLVNSIGAIQAYVSLHQLSHLPASTIAWTFSIYLCLAYGSGIFIGSLFDKKGARWILVVATASIFAGLMAMANCTQLWQFILSFIALGIGNGIALPPLISVINHWFLKKRGLCTGLATSGGSIGGIMFPTLLRHLYTTYGYTWAIRTVAFICLFCMLVSVAMVRERIRRDRKVTELEKFSVHLLLQTKQLFTSEYWHTVDFRFFFLVPGAFAAEIALILVMTYFPSYAIVHGSLESDSYLLLTVWNACGVLGRWLPGHISDTLGRFNVNVLMILCFNLSILVIWLPFGHLGLKTLYVYAAFGGFFSLSVLSMLPTCLAQITVAKELGKKYAVVNAFLSVGNLVVIPIGASVINDGRPRDYDMFVVLVGVLSLWGTFFWTLSRAMIVGKKVIVKV